jgi:hypothetical protein
MGIGKDDLSPDGPHHAHGYQEADPTTVRIEAYVRAHTAHFSEDGQSRHVP